MIIVNRQFALKPPRLLPRRRPRCGAFGGATAPHFGIERSGAAQRRVDLLGRHKFQFAAAELVVDAAAVLWMGGSKCGLRRGLHRICGLRGDDSATAGVGRPLARAWTTCLVVRRHLRRARPLPGARTLEPALLRPLSTGARLRSLPHPGTLVDVVHGGDGGAGWIDD